MHQGKIHSGSFTAELIAAKVLLWMGFFCRLDQDLHPRNSNDYIININANRSFFFHCKYLPSALT